MTSDKFDATGPSNYHAVALGRMLFRDPRVSRWLLGLDIAILAISEFALLLTTERTIDAYRNGESPDQEVVLFLLGMMLVARSGTTLRTRVSEVVTRAVSTYQRAILAEIRRAGLPAVEAMGQPRLRRALTSDAARVMECGNDVVWVGASASMGFLALGYFMATSPQAAPLGLALILGASLLVSLTGLRVETLSDTFEEQKDAIHRTEEELIDGFAQVKLHRPRQEAIQAAIAKDSEQSLEAGASLYKATANSTAVAQAMLYGFVGLVAFGYAKLFPEVSGHTDRLVITAMFMFEPFTMLFLDQLRLSRAGAALTRMSGVLQELRQAPGVVATDREEPQVFTSLELRGVGYRYPERPDAPTFALSPIDLSLRPGEVVFITGRNGSGKSTLLKVLTGLYTHTSGEIRLNGEVCPALDLARLRAHFGAIFAEVTLFEKGYGLEGVSPERVRVVLELMQLQAVVTFADGRFSTIDLSTGQKKRLAMVFALLRDRPIYVFDEWAADQDPSFRELFYRRLLPMLKRRGRAVLAVTHDERYFDVADRRLHLE